MLKYIDKKYVGANFIMWSKKISFILELYYIYGDRCSKFIND